MNSVLLLITIMLFGYMVYVYDRTRLCSVISILVLLKFYRVRWSERPGIIYNLLFNCYYAVYFIIRFART